MIGNQFIMQNLKELSAEKVLELMPSEIHEQLFDTYVKQLYLPKITRLDNIFDEIYKQDFDIDFDEVLNDFCKAFPQLVHVSEEKKNMPYRHAVKKRFYFENKGDTFYCTIEATLDWKENNQLIDFFIQRKLPVWLGISLWWN